MPQHRVVVDDADHLPDHLLELLEDWHRENGNQAPPGSYRGKSDFKNHQDVKIFSGNHLPVPAEIVLIVKPSRYLMLVLREQRGQQQLDKFVTCRTQGDIKLFLRHWLGGDQYDDRMCAVRLRAKPNG
jgi:hypothetical protein